MERVRCRPGVWGSWGVRNGTFDTGEGRGVDEVPALLPCGAGLGLRAVREAVREREHQGSSWEQHVPAYKDGRNPRKIMPGCAGRAFCAFRTLFPPSRTLRDHLGPESQTTLGLGLCSES